MKQKQKKKKQWVELLALAAIGIGAVFYFLLNKKNKNVESFYTCPPGQVYIPSMGGCEMVSSNDICIDNPWHYSCKCPAGYRLNSVTNQCEYSEHDVEEDAYWRWYAATTGAHYQSPFGYDVMPSGQIIPQQQQQYQYPYYFQQYQQYTYTSPRQNCINQCRQMYYY